MSFLGQRFKYFAEVESESITAQRLIWGERGSARAGSFSFEVWEPSSAVKAKLVGGKVFELWAGFVAHASWDAAVKGDLTKYVGLIKNVRRKSPATGKVVYLVEGVDRSAIAHQYIVNDSYTSQRPDQIVTDAWTNYGPSGVTFNNVSTSGLTLDAAEFPHDTLFELMEQMKDAEGWVWRLDADNDLHFKPASSDRYSSALKDTDAIVKGSAEFAEDITNLANRVWVFGSYSESDTFTENFKGNASQHTFKLGYSPIFSSVTVTVAGAPQSVGRDGIVDFTSADVLINVEQQLMRFDSGSPPADAAAIAISYKYGAPVIARREDPASIAARNVYEHVIVDAKITDIAQASEVAKAYIREYGNPTTYGEMQVYVFGIRAGQTVAVEHVTLGVDQDFTVDEVDMEILGPEEAEITLKVRGSPGPVTLEGKVRQIDQRLHALETKDIPQDAPVNRYDSLNDPLEIADTAPTMTYAAPESRVGYALVGYSQVGS